ncbi:hypothetical protein [Yersinia pseudotuberculosis]|uniref:hypothetical protein n=1 Tax=Yersinia pseudotuberculosis TaxID=633 RepID=UPI000BEF2DE1|nr:hypothetical protein [Yersinia pseudotuberculosis]AXY33872.1 hypothetical protein CEQ20_10880 [Yersinia pseudotuberculosis]MBO1560325.1 hypothetical protein [Yersinia pseudotuberculosis]PEI13451.1 hypothetical protein CRM78_09410 [Yersinia pseudotuberculosis]VEE71104.1 Uncharacterised protein [Yersinia pseudotuberculosis]
MDRKLFFSKRCPKCNTDGRFEVLLASEKNESIYAEYFYYDKWRSYDFCLFSIVSYCNSCCNYVSANVAAIHDEVKNATSPLSVFSDNNSELVENENIIIDFDVQPLVPPQYFSSPPTVNMRDLYSQAEKCYSLRAWDSVGVLCRKIIDIESTKMWSIRYPNKECPKNFAERLEKLLVKNIRKNKKVGKFDRIENNLDFSKIDHELFYGMDIIRTQGNDAAHNLLVFHSDEAEAMLIFTMKFMDDYETWRDLYNK